MQVEEQIARSRERRRRVRRGQVAITFAGVAFMVAALVRFPDSALLGLVYVSVALAIVASYVVPNRADEWERRHALRVAAAGFAAMMAWQVGEVVWWATHEGYRANPGKALSAAAAALLAANFFLRPTSDDVRVEEEA